MLNYSPDDLNTAGLSQVKTGAKTSVLVSHMGDGALSAWTIPYCLSGVLDYKLDCRPSSLDSNCHSYLWCWNHEQRLTCCVTVHAQWILRESVAWNETKQKLLKLHSVSWENILYGDVRESRISRAFTLSAVIDLFTAVTPCRPCLLGILPDEQIPTPRFELTVYRESAKISNNN